MSSDHDFEQFIQSAGALGEANDADARRMEASLSSRVAFHGRLPSAVEEALASLTEANESASGVGRTGMPRARWIKLASIVVPVVGVAVAAYSSAIPSSGTTATVGTTVNVAHSDAEPSAIASAGGEAAAAESPPPEVLTLADPSMLPTAASKPSNRSPSARRGPPRTRPLDEELALLSATSTALRAGEPTRTLSLVDEHARDFPNGALGPEFAAHRVLALGALGRREEACVAAGRFLAANPTSPFAPQVRSSCDDNRSKQ